MDKVSNYIKGKSPNALVVLNPGTATGECYMTFSDILVGFEDTYANYIGFIPPAWTVNYPKERFWHLIHSAATQAEVQDAILRSKTRNVGWLYVTRDILPNPWDTLAADPDWSDLLNRTISP